MKTRIIAALAYPRSLVGGEQDLEECRHNGMFASHSGDCNTCHQGPECHWLYQHGEYADLEGKSLRELEEALAFMIGYVDSKILEWRHSRADCKCEACAWLRNSLRLYDQVLASGE